MAHGNVPTAAKIWKRNTPTAGNAEHLDPKKGKIKDLLKYLTTKATAVLSVLERIVNQNGVGLCSMVIRHLKQVFLSIFLPEMYMAVRLMVIDTQNLLTFRIRTNPALWRCPYFVRHNYS